MSLRLDVNIARIVHLNWEMELEAMVAGRVHAHYMASQQDCELGQWLRGRALEQSGAGATLRALLAAHDRFHQAGDRIHQSLLHHKPASSPPDLNDVRQASREIVLLLTQAELEFADAQRPPLTSPVPAGSLFQRLFYGPHEAASERSGVLELNYSRLVHLRWMLDLPEQFRHRGGEASLQSAESCALGVWIQTTGLRKYGNMEEMRRLEVVHADFHQQAAAVVAALRHRRDRGADGAYAKARELSAEVIYLLSLIEFRLLGDASIQRNASIIG
ncbi:MAG: CZB domain-containing protein [Magnetococcus sp. WYHC-3]